MLDDNDLMERFAKLRAQRGGVLANFFARSGRALRSKPEDEVEERLLQAREAFLRACDALRRHPNVITPFLIGVLASLRSLAARTRAKAAAARPVLNASLSIAGDYLSVAAMVTTLAFAPTIASAAGPATENTPAFALSHVRSSHEQAGGAPGSASGRFRVDILNRRVALGGVERGVTASAGLKRNDGRTSIDGRLYAWTGKFGPHPDASGSLWIDCASRSVVSRTECKLIDMALPPPK